MRNRRFGSYREVETETEGATFSFRQLCTCRKHSWSRNRQNGSHSVTRQSDWDISFEPSVWDRMTALQFAAIWDESANLSAPIGHGNVSSMYGLDPCCSVSSRVCSGPQRSRKSRLRRNSNHLPAGHLVQSQIALASFSTMRQCEWISCADRG